MTDDYGLLVDGEERAAATSARLESIDPSTGRPIGTFAKGSADDVDLAVAAAQRAFDAGWPDGPPAERGRMLRTAAERIRADADALARLDALDVGLPLRLAASDVETCARYFEYYSGVADKIHGETIPLGGDFLDFTLREPWGVCGVIPSFNFPLQLMARSVAPALAAGNAVVVKPAEQAPLPSLALGRLLLECGFPPGACNVVAGVGPEAGKALVAHPDVRHVTFTGSLPTGRLVMQAAADDMTSVTLELGGKSPQIVFADADLDAAIEAIVGSAMRTAGQVCSAGTRILVEDAVLPEVAERLASAASSLVVGPAIDGADMGPVISARQRDQVLEALEGAARAGSRALTGGRAPADPALRDGFFVEPTVLADVDPGAPVARHEVFGPVVALFGFSTFEQAGKLANDSEFGLSAGVWTRDLDRAMRMAKHVKSGQVFVNNYGAAGGVELPFGGYKRSGLGREKGLAGLLAYTQTKNVCVRLGQP